MKYFVIFVIIVIFGVFFSFLTLKCSFLDFKKLKIRPVSKLQKITIGKVKYFVIFIIIVIFGVFLVLFF